MINLEEKWLALVKQILQNHLSPEAEIFVYGSRANKEDNLARQFSDLDLCLKKQPMDLFEISKIKDEFEESILPIKVDIAIYENLSPEFQDIIDKHAQKITI